MKQAIPLYNAMETGILAFNRLQHFQTVVAEERHWVSVGKGKSIIGTAYSMAQLRDQISKFHRKKQSKKLRKPYDSQMRKTEPPPAPYGLPEEGSPSEEA
jgi:hypothetical protein